jgi:beta-1,4-mannosyl-glycoprotein beta-1,4-N-acetylglucosaminyltransferase
MIYDLFPLAYETGVLLIRLLTLGPVVDRFCIVEGDRTFTGRPRDPLWPVLRDFEAFAPFADRVDWVGVKLPAGADVNPWSREPVLRGELLPLADYAGCGPDDTVIISDADEIPHPTTVANLAGVRSVWRMAGYYHQLKLDLRAVGSLSPEYPWEFRQPLIGPRSRFTHAEDDRAAQGRRADVRVFNGGPPGWHFSCQGSPKQVADKLSSYSHTELSHITADDVRDYTARRRDIADRCDLERVPLSVLPACVEADPERWAHMLSEGS